MLLVQSGFKKRSGTPAADVVYLLMLWVWLKVKLLFVRGVNEEKEQLGKHDWALFLTTDSQMDDETMPEIYASRWGIEVYFKEAKQQLGFLKEQSPHYSTYTQATSKCAFQNDWGGHAYSTVW